MIHFVLGCVLFFQAEDGIRDLVRSRGLGDVYKRQGVFAQISSVGGFGIQGFGIFPICKVSGYLGRITAVSYTHLTLPTSDLV